VITTPILIDTIRYLQKVYVGKGEEERFVAVVDALKKEVERRARDTRKGSSS
jgi:hypothetical protein